MKRFPILGILFLIPAIALLALAGCQNQKDKTTNPTTSPDPTKAVAKTKITAPTDGKITGIVKLKGDKPDMSVNPDIAKHLEKGICEAGGSISTQNQEWIIGKGDGVANVVIWLEPAADKDFDIKEEHKSPFKKPVVIDQPFCQYVPHVVAVYTEENGFQKLIIKNSSKTLHNVKIDPPKNNPPAGPNMPKGSAPIEYTFKMEAVGQPIKLGCSVHTWMSGKVLTFDHPYFAVTDKDGKFEILNVPTGVELTVRMWHEEKKTFQDKANASLKFKKGDNDLPLEITVR